MALGRLLYLSGLDVFLCAVKTIHNKSAWLLRFLYVGDILFATLVVKRNARRWNRDSQTFLLPNVRILIMPDICILTLAQPVCSGAQAPWHVSQGPVLYTVLPALVLCKDNEVEQLGSHTATRLLLAAFSDQLSNLSWCICSISQIL